MPVIKKGKLINIVHDLNECPEKVGIIQPIIIGNARPISKPKFLSFFLVSRFLSVNLIQTFVSNFLYSLP